MLTRAKRDFLHWTFPDKTAGLETSIVICAMGSCASWGAGLCAMRGGMLYISTHATYNITITIQST